MNTNENPSSQVDPSMALPSTPTPAAPAGNGPRITSEHIDALVASLTYETAHVPGTTSTVATARLPGGFVAAIGHSACIAPENFDLALGKKYAIQDAEKEARDALWQFEGYALYLQLEQLRAAGVDKTMPAHEQRVILELIDLKDKISKLGAFRATPWFANLVAAEQGRLTRQQEAMQAYADILAERITAFPILGTVPA